MIIKQSFFCRVSRAVADSASAFSNEGFFHKKRGKEELGEKQKNDEGKRNCRQYFFFVFLFRSCVRFLRPAGLLSSARVRKSQIFLRDPKNKRMNFCLVL